MHSRADIIILARHAEALVGRAGGNQDGVGTIGVTGVGGDKMSIHIVADPYHVLRREQLHAIAFGLLDDTFRELGSRYAFREARVVIQAFGDTRLTTQATTFDDQHIEAITCSINSGREGSGTTTYDNQVIEFTFGFGLESQFRGQFSIGWFNQDQTVVEDDGGNAQAAVLHLLHIGLAFFILLNVDKIIVDALLSQESFAAFAIAAPIGTIEFDVCMRHISRFLS